MLIKCEGGGEKEKQFWPKLIKIFTAIRAIS
jgi:hypothetical protein